ncbi:hypothetical protein PS1_038714 [Malus domestica]
MCSVYENPYENSLKFDHGGGSGGSYIDDRYGGYNRSRSDLGSDPYGKQYDVGPDAGMVIVFMLTKSNSYTANILLDTVTAATVQHAIAYTGTSQGVYGARETINVWSLSIEHREATITKAQALGAVVHSQGPLFGGVQRNVKSSSDNVVVCWRSLDSLITNGHNVRGGLQFITGIDRDR